MSGGVPVPGGLKRYTNLLAGQSKNAVSITGGTISGVTFSNSINTGIVASANDTSVTSSTTLANVSGLVYTVVPGTYVIRIHAMGSSASSGGWKLAFKLTGTVITSWNMVPNSFTTSGGSAGTVVTTTTDQTLLVNNTSALTRSVVEGTAVIGTGGTMQLQFAQSASNATASILNAGSTIEFMRIA